MGAGEVGPSEEDMRLWVGGRRELAGWKGKPSGVKKGKTYVSEGSGGDVKGMRRCRPWGRGSSMRCPS